MAYNNITQGILKKVAKRYGDDSDNLRAIQLVADARLPFECVADILGWNADEIKDDLTGGNPLDDWRHGVVINFINTIVPDALERGLLPCRDTAIVTEILRVLIELMQARKQVADLQTSVDGE